MYAVQSDDETDDDGDLGFRNRNGQLSLQRPCLYRPIIHGESDTADTYTRTCYASARRGLRGGSAGGGPRPADVGGLGVCDGVGGVGVPEAGSDAETGDGDDDDNSKGPLRSAEPGNSWPEEDEGASVASTPRLTSKSVFWSGDEGALAGGVSDARFSLSLEAIDCKAAEARDVEAEDEVESPSGGRITSALL